MTVKTPLSEASIKVVRSHFRSRKEMEKRANLRWLGNFWATMAGTVANVLPLKEQLDEHQKTEQMTIESLAKRIQLLEDILARLLSQQPQQSKEGSKSGYDSYI